MALKALADAGVNGLINIRDYNIAALGNPLR